MIKVINEVSLTLDEAVKDIQKVKQNLDPNGMFYAFEVNTSNIKNWSLCQLYMTCALTFINNQIEEDLDDSNVIKCLAIVGDGVIYSSTASMNDILACLTDNSDVTIAEAAVYNYQDMVLRQKYICCPAEAGFTDIVGWPVLFTLKGNK